MDTTRSRCYPTKEERMPAGLTDTDSMFSVRVTPWHGLGAVLDQPPASVNEAIDASAHALDEGPEKTRALALVTAA
jgi:hypothetical protein